MIKSDAHYIITGREIINTYPCTLLTRHRNLFKLYTKSYGKITNSYYGHGEITEYLSQIKIVSGTIIKKESII